MPHSAGEFSAAHAATLPGAGWLQHRRAVAAERFGAAALPTATEEEWRYSPVGELRLTDYHPLGGATADTTAAVALAANGRPASAPDPTGAPADSTVGPAGSTVGPAGSAERAEVIASLRERLGALSALVVTLDGRLVYCDVTPAATDAGLEVRALADEDAPSASGTPDAPDAGASRGGGLRSADASEDGAGGAALGGVLAEPPDAFALMNDAFCAAPLAVTLPRGARLADPIAVVSLVEAPDAAVFPRLTVALGDGAEAQVVTASFSGTGAAFVVPVAELAVGPAARLGYLSLQELGPNTTGIEFTAAEVATQGHLSIGLAAAGGGYTRARVDCTLAGRGATGDIAAMYFGEHSQVLDFRTFQNHVAADTNSNLLFVGAVEDRARSIYSGLIRVGPDARGTDAQQTNRILKLSEDVWADSVPNLEIENNDVRCAHASSVGPIDEDHRFYLESRGVPPDVAERLIVEGFFGEVRSRLPVQSVAKGFDELIRAKVGAAR